MLDAGCWIIVRVSEHALAHYGAMPHALKLHIVLRMSERILEVCLLLWQAKKIVEPKGFEPLSPHCKQCGAFPAKLQPLLDAGCFPL